MEGLVDSNFWKNKKVLVTGHTGFKGAWLSLWLHDMGAEVHGFSLPPSSSPNLFDVIGLEKLVHHQIGDVRDLATVSHAVKKANPDIIIHMAAQALVKDSYIDPVNTYATNVMGTVNILEAARYAPQLKVVINVTSDKCYENDDSGRSFVETDPFGGKDPYSNSKGCAELVAQSYRYSFFANNNIAIACARAGNVIGGGDWAPNRLIPDIVRSFLSGKAATIRNPYSIRPWQHVLEPIRGYLLLAQYCWNNPEKGSAGWNFAPLLADSLSVEWIVNYMVNHWGSTAQWELDKQPHLPEAKVLTLNAEKADAHLGWQPKWRLPQALDAVIDWYKHYHQQLDLLSITRQQIHTYQISI